MTVFRPISWLFVADLGVSFRWVQGDVFLDILSGDCRVNRDLPLAERVPTRSTWVDNRDVFAEINRVVGARWPDRQRRHGLIVPEVEPPPPAPAPRQPAGRSTDFVRRRA